MCAGVMWDLLPIERSENRITDAYRLFRPRWVSRRDAAGGHPNSPWSTQIEALYRSRSESGGRGTCITKLEELPAERSVRGDSVNQSLHQRPHAIQSWRSVAPKKGCGRSSKGTRAHRSTVGGTARRPAPHSDGRCSSPRSLA